MNHPEGETSTQKRSQRDSTQNTLTQDTLLTDMPGGVQITSDTDSDREESRPQPSEPKGKSVERKEKESRRFTLDIGNYEDELMILVDNGEEVAREVYATVQTAEEFVESASKDPDAWRDGLRRIAENFRVVRDDYRLLLMDNEEAKKEHEETKAKVTAQTKRLKDINKSLLSEQEVSARLRRLRDRWRADAEQLAKQNDDLKERLKKQEGPAAPEEEVDSDDAHRGEGSRHLSVAPSGLSNPSATRRLTPATNRTQPISNSEEGANKRYPDAPVFHGTHDKDTWEAWAMHVEEKFHQSASLFPSERDKIGYIRDHTKAAAFEVIKTRANMRSENPYQTAEEVIDDLENHFGTYDKIGQANAKIQDPKFAMGVKNKSETFEEFYTRFTSAVAPLNLSEAMKITYLTQYITTRLQYRLTGLKYKSFRDLVEFLRSLDMDLRIVDSKTRKEEAPKKGANQNRPSSSGNPRPSSSRNNTGSKVPRGYTYPKETADRLFKEGRCFKCLKKGHRSSDADAPCKGADPLTKEQVEVVLKGMGVSVEDVPETDTPELESKN